jgi:hypothetical protein
MKKYKFCQENIKILSKCKDLIMKSKILSKGRDLA